MMALKGFFGSLFHGGEGASVGKPDFGVAGPAKRPIPAPAGPGMAVGHESPVPEAAYKKGDVIGGKYEVHSLLGRGGFGEVYLVYSREQHEAVALKTFRREFLANAEAKENFKREALLWMKLEDHPFILAARFVEEFSGRLFVGMDYVAPDDRGRVSLADHLAHARGPLHTDQVIDWAIMFCHGMEHANQRGVKCHRDIKPANILIREDDTLLISDFGLAAAAEAAWSTRSSPLESAGQGIFIGLSLFHTEGKQVCGTPGYLAPEVFRGEGADTRSDIYSFGLVLWQMAAGSQVPPFVMGVAPPRSPRDIDRYAVEIYQQQMKNRVPPTGKPLEAVIERCLAPEPSRRFASFTLLRGELEPILHRRTGRTVKPPPVGERNLAYWNDKGFSLISLGRHDEAVACFRKALEIQPGFAMAHLNLGVALKGKDDLDGAIAEFRMALRLQPDYAIAHANLGGALQGKGDFDGAIAELRTAIRLQPDNADAHNNLGNTLQAKGDLDGAAAEFRAAIRLQPDFVTARTNLGSTLADKGDLDGAVAEFSTALHLQPDDALAHASLGTALAEKGDVDGAIVEYRAALRLQPDDANAHSYLGVGLSDKGDLDGAIAEFRTAIRLQPDLADAHRNLAIALYKKGDVDGEIAEWRTTLRLRPNLAIAHSNLGAALGRQGNLDGAIAEFRTAIRLDPNDGEAQHNLATALQMKGRS
jgi:eukaryotic-like serine/threonine-protein kinase